MKQKKQWITKSLKCIKYDLHEGLLRMYLFYLMGAVSVFVFALDAWRKLHYEVENPGVMELSTKIFEGMPVFEYIQGGPRLILPLHYLPVFLPPIMPEENGSSGEIYFLPDISQKESGGCQSVFCVLYK